MPEFLILRHGETVWNREKRLQGSLDSSLTKLGEEQARIQAQILLALGASASTHDIWCSPQGRARRTAEIIFQNTDARIKEDHRLAEIALGPFEGRTLPQLHVEYPAIFSQSSELDWYFKVPGGEPKIQLAARCHSFLNDLRNPAIIITHGVTSRCLRALAMGLSLDDMFKLSGGQGNIHRIFNGRSEFFTREDLPKFESADMTPFRG